MKKCLVCGKKIIDKKHPNRVYCSSKCTGQAKHNGVFKKCPICKKKFYVGKYLIDKRKHCSKKCHNKSLIGKHPSHATEFKKGHKAWNKNKKNCFSKKTLGKMRQFRGNKHWRFKGILKHQGYVLLYRPNHPFCKKSGYVKRSRLVMEKHLGRYLTREEIVHHINHIRNDDRLKNLMLLSNNSIHRQYHPTSEKTKQKQSNSHKDKTPWNKGKKLHYPVWNKGKKLINRHSHN